MHAGLVEHEGSGRSFESPHWSSPALAEITDKPWLEDPPQLIFVSDMEAALSSGVPFEHRQVVTRRSAPHVASVEQMPRGSRWGLGFEGLRDRRQNNRYSALHTRCGRSSSACCPDFNTTWHWLRLVVGFPASGKGCMFSLVTVVGLRRILRSWLWENKLHGFKNHAPVVFVTATPEPCLSTDSNHHYGFQVPAPGATCHPAAPGIRTGTSHR